MSLDKTHKRVLRVEGQRVQVHLDENGNPVTVSSTFWGDEEERLAGVAVSLAQAKLEQAAARRTKVVHDQKRTAESTKTKRAAAAEFWGNEWLEVAHRKHPKFGAGKIAQEARKIIAMNGDDKPAYVKRDEITVYRARQYLRTARNKPA